MKKRNILVPCFFMLIAAVGCQRELDEGLAESDVIVTLKASQESEFESKTVVQDNIHVYWDAEEDIKVFYGSSEAKFTSTNTEPAGTAEFKGSIVLGSSFGNAGGGTLWALYPYDADASMSSGKIVTSLPTYQSARAGSFARNTNLALARSSDYELQFFNVAGGIRFSLTRNDIRKVVIETLGGEPISGKVRISFADGAYPEVTDVLAGKDFVSLEAPEDGTLQRGEWYYVSCLPTQLSSGIKVSFYTSDNNKGSVEFTSALTIKRSVFASHESIDSGVSSWTPAEVEENRDEYAIQSVTIEIPEGIEPEAMANFKIINAYGEYPLTLSTKNLSTKANDSQSQEFRANLKYNQSGAGNMVSLIAGPTSEPLGAFIASLKEDARVNAWNIAMTMVLTSSTFFTEDPGKRKLIVDAIAGLDSFENLVDEVATAYSYSILKQASPNYSQFSIAPIVNELRSKVQPSTALDNNGIYISNVNRSGKTISFQLKNVMNRVLHIYARRVWLYNNVGVERELDMTHSLNTILYLWQKDLKLLDENEVEKQAELMCLRNETLEDVRSEYNSSITSIYGDLRGMQEEVRALVNGMEDSAVKTKVLDMPIPRILVPEEASYLGIVCDALLGRETSPFEKTVDLSYRIDDASRLFLDCYGMGKLSQLSEELNDDGIKAISAIIHGVILGYIIPTYKFVTGIEDVKHILDNNNELYRTSFYAANHPWTMITTKLMANFMKNPLNYIDLLDKIEDWGWFGACLFIKDFVIEELTGEDNEYYRDEIAWIMFSHVKKIGVEKFISYWKHLSLVLSTVSISESGVNLLGAGETAFRDDIKTTFVIDSADRDYILVRSPYGSNYMNGDHIDFKWDMYQKTTIGNVWYDIKLKVNNNGVVTYPEINNIKTTMYSMPLSDYPSLRTAQSVMYEIVAHAPDYPSVVYARTGYIDLKAKEGALVDIPGQNL